MIEQIVIGSIVLLALALGVRKFWRVSSGQDDSICPSCSGCKKTSPCQHASEIAQQDKTATNDSTSARSD